jgi:hypothetical protein
VLGKGGYVSSQNSGRKKDLCHIILRGMMKGGRVLKARPPSKILGYVGNSVDAGVRSQMPGAIASQCLEILMLYIQDQRNRP